VANVSSRRFATLDTETDRPACRVRGAQTPAPPEHLAGTRTSGRPEDPYHLVSSTCPEKPLEARWADFAEDRDGCVRVGSSILAALKYLNREGLVHRDVAPDKHPRSDDESQPVKLMDFDQAAPIGSIGLAGLTVPAAGDRGGRGVETTVRHLLACGGALQAANGPVALSGRPDGTARKMSPASDKHRDRAFRGADLDASHEVPRRRGRRTGVEQLRASLSRCREPQENAAHRSHQVSPAAEATAHLGNRRHSRRRKTVQPTSSNSPVRAGLGASRPARRDRRPFSASSATYSSAPRKPIQYEKHMRSGGVNAIAIGTATHHAATALRGPRHQLHLLVTDWHQRLVLSSVPASVTNTSTWRWDHFEPSWPQLLRRFLPEPSGAEFEVGAMADRPASARTSGGRFERER